MMTKMKLGLIVMTVLLLASACGTSSPEVAAIANSSAQQAGATTSKPPEAVPVEAGSATVELVDSSQFCAAIEDFTGFPGHIDDLPDSDPGVITEAIESHRRVSAEVPSDAPNIVNFFFSAAAQAAELTMALTADPEQDLDVDEIIPVYSSLQLVMSIDPRDVERYIETTCAVSDLNLELAGPQDQDISLAVPDEQMVPPAPEELCGAIQELVRTARTANDPLDPLANQFDVGQEVSWTVVTALDADTPNGVAAFLRSVAWVWQGAGDGSTDAVVGTVFGLDDETESYMAAKCSNLEDDWLYDPLVPPATNIFTTPENAALIKAAERFADTDETTVLASPLLGDPTRSVIIDNNIIVVAGVYLDREHQPGTGQETDEFVMGVDLAFGQSHSFGPEDLVLISPNGDEFAAHPDQAISLDQHKVEFSIDTGPTSTRGWKLRISSETDSDTVDL